MSALFKKLNHNGHPIIHVLDAPASFDAALADLDGVEIRRSVTARGKVQFAIAFAQTITQRDRLSAQLGGAADGDAIIWIAYPKGSSKQYRCEFNRDGDWTVLGEHGFEPVRQVAIDDDWSALRFRRLEHIKTFTREAKHATSAAGKQRARRS